MNEIPNEGGSYIRNEDGSLTRVVDAPAPAEPGPEQEPVAPVEDAAPVANAKKGK